MEDITSPSWISFLQAVKEAKEALGNPEVLWYRGHANSDYYLLPSLLRSKNGLARERYLFTSFRKLSDRILKRRESEWETLFDMQHYGVSTRLLDWSETFGIALFFAATYNKASHSGTDAAIYLLDPIELNEISGVHSIFRIPEDEHRFSYTKIYWEHTPFSPSAPIAIEPIFINDRMLAQRGMFTVHNDKRDPIEKLYPSAVKKVILPSSTVPAALEFLELSNLNIFSVFPDLAGLADYLMRTSGL